MVLNFGRERQTNEKKKVTRALQRAKSVGRMR